MNARMPLAMAHALAAFAPPQSEVHRIVSADACTVPVCKYRDFTPTRVTDDEHRAIGAIVAGLADEYATGLDKVGEPWEDDARRLRANDE